jgi:4,5-DOPA dioxygenase extradiol
MFVSHGAPTYAIEPRLAGAQLGALGNLLGKPRAIVVVSPHWMTSGLEITATESPQTVHDFGGFPNALYDLQYPAPGAPALARQIQQQLATSGMQARLNGLRGLDHGTWVPLLHLYPDADVPTLQVSLPYDASPDSAFALGKALAPLANDGVLIIGSGSLTHNLYEFRMSESEGDAAAYAQEFSTWIRQAVAAGNLARLRQALDFAPHAARAHPTTEHFLPLLVAAGAALEQIPVTVLNGGIRHGVLAMESYVFGQALNLEFGKP